MVLWPGAVRRSGRGFSVEIITAETVPIVTFCFVFRCRSGNKTDAELWEEHVQENQYRPTDERLSPLCECLFY